MRWSQKIRPTCQKTFDPLILLLLCELINYYIQQIWHHFYVIFWVRGALLPYWFMFAQMNWEPLTVSLGCYCFGASSLSDICSLFTYEINHTHWQLCSVAMSIYYLPVVHSICIFMLTKASIHKHTTHILHSHKQILPFNPVFKASKKKKNPP